MTTTFKYFNIGKYNGFVSKARVSAFMYFLVNKYTLKLYAIFFSLYNDYTQRSIFNAIIKPTIHQYLKQT